MKALNVLLMSMAFCLSISHFGFAQGYLPYPQGNTGLKHMKQFVGSAAFYFDEFWYATDTTIAGETYTTKFNIENNQLFLREDAAAEQSFAYSSLLQQELDITMPANIQVGDTVVLTNIAYVFGVFPSFFYDGFTHEFLGVVMSLMDQQTFEYISFSVYAHELSEPNGTNPLFIGSINFHRGRGISSHSDQASYTSSRVCLVNEGVYLLQGAGMPNCFANIEKEIQEEAVLFPNVIVNSFQIKLLNDDEVFLQMFDATGKCVKSLNYVSQDYVDCRDLNAGLYFVHFTQNYQLVRLKAMKL